MGYGINAMIDSRRKAVVRYTYLIVNVPGVKLPSRVWEKGKIQLFMNMIGLFMKILKSYYLQEFRNKETYTEFIKFMLLHSDFFSLIYFKYRENERMKHKTKNIYNNLKKFKEYSQNTQKWPNTETKDKDHFYKIIFYRSDIKCLDSLLQVDDIYDWDYPDAPMDLCFYRDGYCWLAVTSHEYMGFLYTDNKVEVEALKGLGVDLTFSGEEEVMFCYESVPIQRLLL